MTFNGWATNLNDILLTTCHSQADWDDLDCAPATILDTLVDTPDGLDLPGLRTEDVTYFQRDGVKHFSDWYTPRIVTLQGVLNSTTCVTGDCTTVREQLSQLVQAWKKTCCDQELVVFPPCYEPDLTDGINVYPDGTFDVDADGWTGDLGAAVARVTTPVHTGAGSLRITWATDPVPYDDPTSTGQAATGPALIGLTEGDRYTVSAWLYAETGEPALVLGCSDSGGLNAVYSDPIPADGTWHQASLTYDVPDTGEAIPFVRNAEATTSGDLGYVDDVEMMLLNPVDRTINGPFGIVGRPREFKYKWDYNSEPIVRFIARFDAVDHRMYVLDECGTPGFNECVTIEPGTQILTVCLADPVCFSGSGFCFTTPSTTDVDSVTPAEVLVVGTERVYPEIVLMPTLSQPFIENITTGEFITYSGTVGDTPVTINTEDGTAFDAEGNSLTHLLGGSIYLSMEPGNYQWRLVSSGDEPDPDQIGFATLCFRPTVVNA